MAKNKATVFLHKKDKAFWNKNAGILVKLICGGVAFLAKIIIEKEFQKIDEKVAEFAEDQKLGYHEHAALRLICRSRLRDRDHMITDLEKAAWYLNRCIKYKRTQQLLNPKHDLGNVLDGAYKKSHCQLHSDK